MGSRVLSRGSIGEIPTTKRRGFTKDTHLLAHEKEGKFLGSTPKEPDRTREMSYFREKLKEKLNEKRELRGNQLELLMKELDRIEFILKNAGTLILETKEMLTVIANICILYEHPLYEARKFVNTYKTLGKINERAVKGEMIKATIGAAIGFKRKVLRFADVEGLNDIYVNVLMSSKGRFSLYRISYVTPEELDRIEGKG